MIRSRRLLPLLLLAFVTGAPVRAQIVVNEVCVSNLNSYADNFGEFEDWFELYNAGAAAVDISGWYISNRPGNPMKWQVPPGAVIPAGGHQVFFASKRNTSGGGFYHTNFKLSQNDWDHVVVSDMNGNVIDDFGFTPLDRTKLGHSRGRTTSGAATWSLFNNPTPGAANAGASPEYLVRPTLNPPAGFYSGSVNVTMTGPAGATIRYTLDGTEPTAASTAYTGPIPVNATTVVRAACFDGTSQPSFTETNTYLVNTNHTIPVVSIAGDQLLTLLNGNGGIRPYGNLEYFSATGQLWDEAVGEFNEHGQDSWAYGQRGVDYIVRDQTGYNNAINHEIFRTKAGRRDKYQRLILKAAAGDNYDFGPGQPAHIRDMYVQALSQVGELKVDERSYEPAVMYVNGQYWGVYDIREKVDDSDFTRIYYGQDEYDIQFLKTWGGTWVEYGGPQATADWNALQAFIAGNNMGDPVAFAYVDSLLNWQSLIDYFCLNSYTVCADWLNWNTGWWRGLDPAGDKKKWRYILWDMDATFGHYANFTGIPDQTANADPCNVENLPNPGGQGHTVILTKLVQENQMVRDYYVNRYIDLGNTLFSCDFMIPFLDSLIANIEPEMPAQIARWGGTMAAWQNNVQVLRDFITTRCVTIQQGLMDCYDLTGPYAVEFDVDPPASGRIQVNSQVLPQYPFNGTYYGGITTTLAPLPEQGWVFSHWSIGLDTILPSLFDSLVTLTIDTNDRIVAHFIPPTTHDVLLDVDPRGSARIEFMGTMHETFPVVVQAPDGISVDLRAYPAEYFDFLYWEVRQNHPSPGDTTRLELSVKFLGPDTVVAHLEPQQYVYWVPNSFTPNGDGINDVWQPFGNVIDRERFDLKIFDRWGEVVLESKDPSVSWDGSDASGKIREGVYVYRAYVMNAITKEREEIYGHVSVIR